MAGTALVVAEAEGTRVATATWLKRLGSAVVGIPIFVGIMVAPSWLFRALVVVVSAMASWELVRMLAPADRAGHRGLAALVAAAVTASFLVPGAPLPALTLAVLVLLTVSLASGRLAATRSAEASRAGAASMTADPTVAALVAVMYVGWLMGHALLLHAQPDGTALVLFLVGVTWAGESAAYAVGAAIGRHRLAPVISPRKTVEGAAAQLLASAAVAAPLALGLLPAWPLGRAVLAGAVLGVVGQAGDLAESVMKRSVGVKDAGGILPGHGGMLDRIDGLLFNAAVLFYFVRWTGGAA